MSERESGQQGLPESTRMQLTQKALDHLWIHTRQWNELAEPGGLQIFTHGNGIRLVDVEGKTYIDAMSGLWSVNVGHGRKEIAEAVYKQMQDLVYINTFAYTSIPPIELSAKLAQLAPGSISKAFFVNSGSEAVETAIKMVRQYHYLNGQQKRYKIIARRNSYHGTTLGALSVNGSPMLPKKYFEPLLPGVSHVPGVNCYRCEYGLSYPECNLLCATMVDKAIQFEGPDTVAAFIAEPISTSAGTHVPPTEYWKTIREVCDKHGVLLIADEVINGFGRTGKWFGMEHFGIVPDIMTIAKGLISSYLPMAGVLAKAEIAERFKGSRRDAFSHGITFGTHPVAAAAALKNIEIIEKEKMVENSAEMGAYMKSRLETLKGHELVGDVRGLGLMCAVELVKDKGTKEPFGEADDIGSKLTPKLVDRGLLTRAGGVIALAPPLCTTKEDVDQIVQILGDAITELESEILVAQKAAR